MRYIALAHLKDGKNFTEVASALRVTRHAAMRWLKWFLLKRLDMAWISTRSISPHADPIKQAEIKKISSR